MTLLTLDSNLTLDEHGQKATLLARAQKLGERTPAGFVIDARTALAMADGLVQESDLARALAALGAPRVAVRSSPSLSLPGALATELDVPADPASVQAALARVVRSVDAKSVRDQLRAREREAPQQPWCAVLVQAFVSASASDAVGAVVCTRNPTTGEPGAFGEYMPHQGAQAVVSGRADPRPLTLVGARRGREDETLERAQPALFAEIAALCTRLERAFAEPLELELVYDAGTLWLLQVRPLVLAPRAQARLALDAIESDAPAYPELLRRLLDALPSLVESRLPPPEQIDPSRHLARGLAASPGVGRGVLVIDLDSALERAQREPVVLCRRDAVPEDVAAFRASRAVLTTSGGLTSHAAVIARGLRVPAVVGASQIRVDVKARCLVDGRDPTRVLVQEGDPVTLDAHRGILYRGDLAPEPTFAAPELARLCSEARKLRRVGLWVRAPLAQAHSLRSAFELDGTLSPWEGEGHAEAPPPKDSWLEVPASEVLARLPELPAGYGLLLRGQVDDTLLRAVRSAARLRALGVEARGAAGLSEAVDLVLVAGRTELGEREPRGPRRVLLVDSEADFASAGHERGGILACDASKALRFALGLASVSRV